MYHSAVVLLILFSSCSKESFGQFYGLGPGGSVSIPQIHSCCGEIFNGVCNNPCFNRPSRRCRFFQKNTIDVSDDLLVLGPRGGKVDLSRYVRGQPRTMVVRLDQRPFVPFEYRTFNCRSIRFIAERFNRIRNFLRTLDFTDPVVRARLSKRLGRALSDRPRVQLLQERLVEKLARANTYRDIDLDEIDGLSNRDVIDLFNTVARAGLNSAFFY